MRNYLWFGLLCVELSYTLRERERERGFRETWIFRFPSSNCSCNYECCLPPGCCVGVGGSGVCGDGGTDVTGGGVPEKKKKIDFLHLVSPQMLIESQSI